MTERKFQDLLADRLRWDLKHDFVIPNYHPPGWWECDLFSVTKASIAQEYEIKLTRPDFKADAKKGTGEFTTFNKVTKQWDRHPGVTKHAKLALGDERGPARFFYVTPPGLLVPEEVPEFAGLLELHADRRILQTMKKAPRLHQKPVSVLTITHLAKCFSHRYWNIRLANKAVQESPDPLDMGV